MISLNFEILLTHGCRFIILWSSWIAFIWNILFKCTTPSTNPNYVSGIIRLSAYHLSLLYPTQTLDIVVVFLWHFCWLCKIRVPEHSPKPDSLKIYFLNLESIICKENKRVHLKHIKDFLQDSSFRHFSLSKPLIWVFKSYSSMSRSDFHFVLNKS